MNIWVRSVLCVSLLSFLSSCQSANLKKFTIKAVPFLKNSNQVISPEKVEAAVSDVPIGRLLDEAFVVIIFD